MASKRVREIERADFEKLDTDFTESLSAIARAKMVLQKQNYDRAQAAKDTAALMQVSAFIPAESRPIIDAFLARNNDVLDDPDSAHLAKAAPEAHGYRSASQSIIDLLSKLHQKFDAEKCPFFHMYKCGPNI